MLKPSKYLFSKLWYVNIDFGKIEYAESDLDNKNFHKFIKTLKICKLDLNTCSRIFDYFQSSRG